MRRGCLLGTGVLLLLCLGLGAVAWFAGLPALRGGLQDGIADGIATAVVDRLPPSPGLGVAPGTTTITERDLQASLLANAGDRDATPAAGDADILLRLTPAGVEIGISAQGQDATYRGRLAAEDGRLVLPDLAVDNDVLALFLPPADLAAAIADGVNRHLAANDLRLESVTPTDGAVTLTTAPATP